MLDKMLYIPVCIITVCLTISHIECKKSEPLHELVDVKPGGSVYEFEYKAFGVTCKFTYACQGGTNEEWKFDIERDDKMVTCSVHRPSGVSYLFFQQFKLEIAGGNVQLARAMGNGKELSPDEYIVNDHSIQHFEGKFESQLSGVSLVVEKQKKKKETTKEL